MHIKHWQSCCMSQIHVGLIFWPDVCVRYSAVISTCRHVEPRGQFGRGYATNSCPASLDAPGTNLLLGNDQTRTSDKPTHAFT